MQLFTIGLWRLNIDGTYIELNGERVETYDNDDIRDFSRIWTGFDYQPLRGNIEFRGINEIDPMLIKPSWRDEFPKMNLFDGYIGDAYPLCKDIPLQSFLRKGAHYRIHGFKQENLPEDDDKLYALHIYKNSDMYKLLCNNCTIKVVERFYLPYDINENFEIKCM